MLYYLLHDLDPEFSKFSRWLSIFPIRWIVRPKISDSTRASHCYLIQKKELLAFDRSAVARVVESSRMVEDAEKLSMEIRCIADLLQESHHWAKNKGSRLVRASHVDQAIAHQQRRLGRVPDRWREETLRGSFHIATTGTCVGQINGLSVIQLGGHAFGHRVASQPKCAWEEVKWWILSVRWILEAPCIPRG